MKMKKIFSLIAFSVIFLIAQISSAAHVHFNYRAHVQNIGWQPWVSNGRLAGTEGEGLRMEAIQIRIVKKGSDYERDRYNRDRYGHERYKRNYDDYNW